jgi:hypothetical protein
MKTVSAKLQWMYPEKGGRRAIPPVPRYSTIARFEQQRDTWHEEAWSLIVEWSELPDASLAHHVNVRFLVENAPENLLVTGNRFDLMEGERVVATGVID